jgi:two-component system, cell cycle sensor histidine kinase and response regulator CckA
MALLDTPNASALASTQMQLLLVGDDEKDFAYLRNLLAGAGGGHLGVDYAASPEEARGRMGQTTYDLLLCSYKSSNRTALQFLHEIRKEGAVAPVIFLSDHVDQAAVETAIKAGACDCLQTSSLDEASITCAIRYAIDVYCKERQRQKTEDTLRKLSRAVEQSADLVIITDRAGVIEYVNPAFEALTGYSRKQAVGRTPRLLKWGHQSAELYHDLWKTILAGNVFRGVMVNRKKNGDIFYAEKTITPLRDADGRITHFISNDRDITERRRLELQLQQTQRLDAIGKLAGGVAHDFNNLLMVISAYAELMLDQLSPEHPLCRNVLEIQSASRRAADLTRQLLAFGRKQVQDLQLLDLNSTMQEIHNMLLRLIGEDIELVFVPGKNLGRVKADTVQIEQVVMNLAANARDAMPNGGKLTIETTRTSLDESYQQRHSLVPEGDYVMLAVSDSGHGISPEHISHIFEPFYTTKTEGKGTGLGLATVYGIVKQNSGFIWVYSEPEFGTTFKIYLPRVESEIRTIIQPHSVEHVANGCETLLLVEDEAAVRRSTREFLATRGYIVLEAENGQHALKIAREFKSRIHLMITDVVMPQLGGAGLASQLAVDRPEMHVLFVSGYAENTILRQGAIDVNARFLQKPFSLKALACKIREILDSKVPALVAAAAAAH